MFERISVNPKICGGQPCIKGTRIPIYIILQLIGGDYSFERIINECYPQITPNDIKAVLEYAVMMVKDEEVLLPLVV